MNDEELNGLVDELVAKGGPKTGQIKLNQDPTKVARLLELGWAPIIHGKPSDEKMIKKHFDEPPMSPKQVKIVSKVNKKDRGFVSDTYRNELDADVLREEITKREHKGKVKTITTIKHMDLTIEGEYVTEYIIDLKE